MNLVKRIELWISEYDRPAYSQICLLLRDCCAEIKKLCGEKLSLKYELDVLNESGAGTIQILQAEIQRLLTNNDALTGLCQDYASEIKALEAMREYVPMTDDERWNIFMFGTGVQINESLAEIEAEVIKRAGLRIKERDNG